MDRQIDGWVSASACMYAYIHWCEKRGKLARRKKIVLVTFIKARTFVCQFSVFVVAVTGIPIKSRVLYV